MSVPSLPSTWARRLLEPTPWNLKALRKTLIGITVASAVFPAFSPFPALFVFFVWLVYAVPHVIKQSMRRHFIHTYRLDPAREFVDAANVWRLRRMLVTAFLVVAFQLPFAAFFAINYPFFRYSAQYWLAEAPSTAQPRPGPTMVGLMPVLNRYATQRSIVYVLPGGPMEFSVNGDGNIVFGPGR